MSIRTRLIITFIAIIVLVAAIMGLYQSYLLNSYFKQNEAQAMTSQAQQLRILIRNLHIYPQEALIIDIAAWAGSLANARVLITDNKGKVLIDSAGQSSLVDENLPTSLLSGTLSQGIIDSSISHRLGKTGWLSPYHG